VSAKQSGDFLYRIAAVDFDMAMVGMALSHGGYASDFRCGSEETHVPKCVVNVPYVQMQPSTYGHFCNLSKSFRASVFCG
jgi:hypothetical protein